jgi:hypothetical protein
MPENGSLERFLGKGHDTHRCSPSFRPGPFLSCEHMFSSLRTSPLAQRTLGALDLARSFLMLEDDDGVDWEVDRNEPDTPVHPHRAPLRRGFRARRAGAIAPPGQECISPTSYGQPANAPRGTMRWSARATRESELSADRGSRAGGMEKRAARDCHERLA